MVTLIARTNLLYKLIIFKCALIIISRFVVIIQDFFCFCKIMVRYYTKLRQSAKTSEFFIKLALCDKFCVEILFE